MVVRMNVFDLGGWSEDEQLITERSFDEWARVVVARSEVQLEECAAVDSVRPTMPVFQGEPWR